MRRTKLFWFALGAGTAGLISIATDWYLQSSPIRHDRTAYLVLTEPFSESETSTGGGAANLNSIANNTGKILRDCGARVFETTFLYEDHAPTADFPIITENYNSLGCVVKGVQSQGIHFEVEVRSPPRAADEMRSAS